MQDVYRVLNEMDAGSVDEILAGVGVGRCSVGLALKRLIVLGLVERGDGLRGDRMRRVYRVRVRDFGAIEVEVTDGAWEAWKCLEVLGPGVSARQVSNRVLYSVSSARGYLGELVRVGVAERRARGRYWRTTDKKLLRK